MGTLTLAILALPAGILCAQEGTPLLLEAVAGAPLLEAARQRVVAAHRRIEAAGRIPDPEAEAMLMRGPGGRDMWELNLMQPLPRRGERAADRDRAQAAVAMAAAEYAIMAGELAADVSAALAEAEGAQSRRRVLEAQRVRLESVLQSIESRLETATNTRLADRLTVQTRMAAMQLDIDAAERTAMDALADLRGRLGLAPGAAVPAFAAPSVDEVAPGESPASAAAEARIEEADAMTRQARASARPMTAVGLRLERERGGSMGGEDRVGLAFSSEIPWRSRGYARAEARAAGAERAAATAEDTGARFRISSAVSRVERAERLAAIARRLAGETSARLDAQYDALVRAAGAGTAAGPDSTVLTAVEIFEQAALTELKVIEAETAVRVARADLWRHVPASRFLPDRS